MNNIIHSKQELFDRHFSEFDRQITVDLELCRYCNVSRDGWNRKGVSPFILGCFIYKALQYNLGTPAQVLKAVIDKWDSLMWTSTPIHISIWNKAFNGTQLTSSEWARIQLPLTKIDSIYTTLTSGVKHVCYPVFMGLSRAKGNTLLICSEESYHKTLRLGTASKLTVYGYKESGEYCKLLDGLRRDVLKVVVDF